jgi:cation:H+ antiporter
LTEFLQTRALALFEWLKHPDHFRAVADLMLTPGWWQLLLCFTASSFLMIHRLNAVERNGFEGTLVGTLVMPYFSGFPNLCFAYLLARKGSDGAAVLENCLVNNVTNLTLVLAIPALFWGLDLFRKGKKTHDDDSRIHHLSLLLSLLAMIFFLAAVYVVSRDGKITAPDGMILVGIFFFWQLYHVFDVLKNNTRKERGIKKRIVIDFLIIGICAWGIFSSTDKLVSLILSREAGFFSKTNIGFLSGILMVVPNAFLAFYYSAVKRADIAYSSQVGDCHICIPLCVGLFALFTPITVPPSFETAIFILMGASAGHFLFMAVLGRLPRFSGLILTGLYTFFLYKEII